MSEALLVSCPKCGTRLKIRQDEDSGRCEACNAVVTRGAVEREDRRRTDEARALTPSVVLVGSLLLIAAGAAAFRMVSRGGLPARAAAPGAVETSARPPPEPATPEQATAGAIAWESEARAPIVVSANEDSVEDVFGFFREWDGRSAWTSYGGVFDGKTLAPLWRSEPIDPQMLKLSGIVPTALAVGGKVAMSDATPLLRVFDLASGHKLFTLRMAGPVVDMCKAPDPASRIWLQVSSDKHALVDLESGKATFAPRPAWCALPDPPPDAPAPTRRSRDAGDSAPAPGGPCKDDFKNPIARASCLPAGDAPSLEGATGHYMLKSGGAAVVLATKDDRPVAVGVGPGFKPIWSTPFVADDTKPTPEAPRVAELADGRLYAVYGKVYFDARLVALDATSGARLWDVPLVGSLSGSSLGDLGRGEARGLVATKSRVYVSRSGGGLDVFDAEDGKAVGTIGTK